MSSKRLKKVVVVDDNRFARQWVEKALAGQYEVAQADSAMTAGAVITRVQPDLVLLDVHMPALSGHEVVDTLRQRSRKPVPIVFHSGLPRVALEEKVRESGANGFIEKSKDVDLFRKQVAQFLGEGESPPASGVIRHHVIVVGHATAIPTDSLLKRGDVSVTFVPTLAQALQEIEKKTPRLLIFGSNLQVSEVSSFIRRLREEGKRRQVSILAVVGSGERGRAHRLIQAGANKALVAPFEPPEFLTIVGSLLGVPPRMAARLIVRLEVRLDAESEFRVGFSHNISSTGMLVELDGPVELGDEFKLGFYLPDQAKEIVALGRVMRIHDVNGNRVTVGLHFFEIEEVCSQLIADWAERNRASHGG